MIFITKRYVLINHRTYSCTRTDLVYVCPQTLPLLSKGGALPDFPLHAKGTSSICKTLFQATSSCVLNIPTVGVEDDSIRMERS